MKEKDDDTSEIFDDDPEENIRIENDIMKLKLQAEHGAIIGSSGDLSPGVELDFLQNVQQFESSMKNARRVTVFELIGKPAFKKENELNDDQLKSELEKVFELLKKNQISLAVLGEYEERIIYRFITEEFFAHETDDIKLPGVVKNFTYEEFHPNHKMEIHDRTMEFLGDWFEKKFSDISWELNDPFILATGKIISKAEVIKKINDHFEGYSSFMNAKFAIADISFQWDEGRPAGMGHSEGFVKYDTKSVIGETIEVEGPFKLYMSNEGGWWSIFYFIFPGFVLE